MSEERTDSEPEEEKDGRNYRVMVSEDERSDEDEYGSGCRQDEGAADSEEEDEEYEEVVVKPKHLNEVTSLTDKTSPWTSILTDPDLVSLESMEVPEDPDLNQDEDGSRQTVNVDICHSHVNSAKQEKRDSLIRSAGNASDTETDDEQSVHLVAKDCSTFSTGSEITGPPSIIHHTADAADASDASCSIQNLDPQLQSYPLSQFVFGLF